MVVPLLKPPFDSLGPGSGLPSRSPYPIAILTVMLAMNVLSRMSMAVWMPSRKLSGAASAWRHSPE